MSNMKLYTEEQLDLAFLKGHSLGSLGVKYTLEIVEDMRKELIPIELPSEEEIEEMGKDVIIYNDTKRGWFIEGLKCMRDKIKGGNK